MSLLVKTAGVMAGLAIVKPAASALASSALKGNGKVAGLLTVGPTIGLVGAGLLATSYFIRSPIASDVVFGAGLAGLGSGALIMVPLGLLTKGD
jgi:hypothetical protein